MMKTLKLDAVKFGLAGGITTVICIFLTGLTALLFPATVPSITAFFGEIYGLFGLPNNFLVLVLMSAGSFIDGFILTWIFAWIYNKLL